MIEQLFGSKTRVKLLQLFYSKPNRSFYVREITRKIDEQINSVRRELANLLNVGIITSDTSNNKVYYEVDQKYEYYGPFREIFGGQTGRTVKKSEADLPAEEAADVKALGNVEVLALMGELTRDKRSGVDVLVVGNVNQHAMNKYVTELEKQEGKELRYSVLSVADFTYRLQIKDRFITNVLASKKQVLVDKPGLLSAE